MKIVELEITSVADKMEVFILLFFILGLISNDHYAGLSLLLLSVKTESDVFVLTASVSRAGGVVFSGQ